MRQELVTNQPRVHWSGFDRALSPKTRRNPVGTPSRPLGRRAPESLSPTRTQQGGGRGTREVRPCSRPEPPDVSCLIVRRKRKQHKLEFAARRAPKPPMPHRGLPARWTRFLTASRLKEVLQGGKRAQERPSVGPLPALDGSTSCRVHQALLKLDCQGLVARLVMDFVLLTTAVEVAGRWRELAERLAKVSRQQMDAYEAPHRDKNGVVDGEVTAALSLLRALFASSTAPFQRACVTCAPGHVEAGLRLPGDVGGADGRQLPGRDPRPPRGPGPHEEPHHQTLEAPERDPAPGPLPGHPAERRLQPRLRRLGHLTLAFSNLRLRHAAASFFFMTPAVGLTHVSIIRSDKCWEPDSWGHASDFGSRFCLLFFWGGRGGQLSHSCLFWSFPYSLHFHFLLHFH